MKLLCKMFFVMSLSMLSVFSFSCASSGVKRVDYDKEIELDGYWSVNDVRIVCDDIIGQVLKSPRVARFEDNYGRVPVVTIHDIRNDSDEYIDTEIVADNLKTAILNSGKLEFMANKHVRGDLRDEIADQADHAKTTQAKKFDNEDAADFALSGSIKTMVQNGSKKSLRSYFVTIELNDIESGRTVGIFQPSPENQPNKIISGKLR